MSFQERFGSAGIENIRFFSSPGRSEICGNHTDHNHGKILAASIDLDCIAAVAPAKEPVIRICDKTYGQDFAIDLTKDLSPQEGETGSPALVRGIAAGFQKAGLALGGFEGCFSSRIIPAAGVSSSAAFEMLIGAILNHLYNNGAVSIPQLAVLGQTAENIYWKKSSGLQDQMASGIGGLIAVNFANSASPQVENIPFDLAALGYRLILVNTGGNHAALSGEYSAIPREMKAAAACLGQEVLQGIAVEDLAKNLEKIRSVAGDRAALRAFHFAEENLRVERGIAALKKGDFPAFLKVITDSGNSSWKWLQNTYVALDNPVHQNVPVCLALTEIFIRLNGLEGKAACRVHGGGFAGVIQVFLPETKVSAYTRWICQALGSGPEETIFSLSIRSLGVVEVP
jgi:galactokinase